MLNLIERRGEIVQLTESNERVDVESLARRFGVSTVTIRNDLKALSAKGLVVRSRGGAVASTRLTRELSVQEKYKESLSIKRRLGRAAAELIGAEVRDLLIDSGTTTEEVALALVGRANLSVMTNGLNIASALAAVEGIEVRMTGGMLRKKSMSFFGSHAEESLRLRHFQKLILGTDGIDSRAGVTTHFEHEASLNRMMCKVAQQIILVADSSKFGRCGSHIICGLDEIDVLVTDAGAPLELLDELRAKGIDVRVVARAAAVGESPRNSKAPGQNGEPPAESAALA